MHRSLVFVAAAVTVASPLAGQARAVTLSKPLAEFADPFSSVSGVRELADGRVMVTDTRDKTAMIVDLKSGNSAPVGREGEGPGEYRMPAGLWPAANDGTLLLDPQQGRILRIGPDGKATETIGYADRIGFAGRMRGADAQGRLYFEGAAFGSGSGTMSFGGGGNPLQTRDSVPIIRWDRARDRVDSIGRLKGPTLKMNVGGTSQSRTVMIRQQPLTSQDEWGVAPDGRVAIVRNNPYRVDWISPAGAVTAGTPVGVAPLPVTEADKAAFIKQVIGAPRISLSSGGRSGASGPKPEEPKASDYDWPEFKPPFEAGSVRVAPDGMVWVLRTRAAGDDVPVYDVFDGQGKLTFRVTFAKGVRLVGFGAGGNIYTTRADEDDLLYLQRYAAVR